MKMGTGIISDSKYPSIKMLIICGTHGNETNAIISTMKAQKAISAEIDTIKIPYYVEFIYGWNETGVENEEREFVEEKEGSSNDLNRVFTLSSCEERTKDELINCIKRSIDDSVIVIDVHNSHHVLNAVVINNDKYASSYIRFCVENHLQYILTQGSAGTIKYYGTRLGKRSFTIELDEMGACSNLNAKLDENANFIKTIAMAAAINPFCVEELKCAVNPKYEAINITAHSNGCLMFNKGTPMTYYTKGEVIATITNYNATVLEYIYAPSNGWLVTIPDGLIAHEGVQIGMFQPVIDIDELPPQEKHASVSKSSVVQIKCEMKVSSDNADTTLAHCKYLSNSICEKIADTCNSAILEGIDVSAPICKVDFMSKLTDYDDIVAREG